MSRSSRSVVPESLYRGPIYKGTFIYGFPITTSRMTLLVLCFVLLIGCDTREMVLQPKKGPLDGSPLFADGRASRPTVPGTVPRGHLRLDSHFYEGKING